MKLPVCRRFLFLLLALIGLFAGPALAQNSLPWTVQNVSGDARHTLGGSESPLAGGDQVGIGSKVTTAADARVVLTRGAERMTMSPGSEIVIPADTNGLVTRILQNLGTLLLKVNKRPEQHFEVATPYLAALVKGTTFTVSVDLNGSAVHVVEGLVQVDDIRSGQSGLVRPGQTGVVPATPGGGLQISGNKVPSNETQVATEATTGPEASREDTKKSSLKITKSLGNSGIDIAALTDGFLIADVGTGRNAGGELQETEASSDTTVPAIDGQEVLNSDSGKSGDGAGSGGGKGATAETTAVAAIAEVASPVLAAVAPVVEVAAPAVAAVAPVIEGVAPGVSAAPVVAVAAPVVAPVVSVAAPVVAPVVSAPVVSAPVIAPPVVSVPVVSAPVITPPAIIPTLF